MDKLEQYRQIVQNLLLKYGEQKLSYGDVDREVIFDSHSERLRQRERDRYQVVDVGWDANQFIYGCSVHIDIKNGKVWIQWNSTEDDIAADLVDLGISKSDIVIGTHSPDLRKFTEYAVG